MSASTSTKTIIAFAAVYFIWGSTYLAIRFAIDTIPPLFMAGARFIIAGSAMYAWARYRGAEMPTRIQWRSAAIVGGLLLLGGNGAVVWAEQVVPSGLTALLISTVPLWMVMLDSLHDKGHKLTKRNILGLMLGFIGVGFLITPGSILGNQRVDVVGATVLLLGALSWSVGSLYSRRVVFPKSLILVSGMQMLAGGALLIAVSLVTGEAGRLNIEQISPGSLLALLYLILFGSIAGYTAYTWLLVHTTPARAATYAYVNPLVAVMLGWLIGGEELTLRTVLAAAVIITAVVVIITRGSASPQMNMPKEQEGAAAEPKLQAAAE